MQGAGGDLDLLRGISSLINTQNAKTGVNYEEIEKSLIQNGNTKQQSGAKDPSESYRDELSSLAKTLGIKFDSPVSAARSATHSSAKSERSSRSSAPSNDEAISQYLQNIGQSQPAASPMRSSPQRSSHSEDLGLPSSYLEELDGSSEQHDGGSPKSSPQKSASNLFPNFDYPAEARPQSPMRSSPAQSTEFVRRTHEQSMHDQIKNVMSNMGSADADFIILDQASKDDEIISMLEEIDSLRSSLEEEDAKGLNRIPVVTQTNTYAEVENVLRRLRLKNDRARYTSLADEFLLWGAQGLEELFDGKRRWFGNHSPNLVGWSKDVAVKLRRLRHDTSTLVSGVMHDYNIGPGLRILLELVPNMFMYAKRKKNSYGKETLFQDQDIARHMNNIRSIDED
jgi:hypothetical protein